jgi:hypothetical protein
VLNASASTVIVPLPVKVIELVRRANPSVFSEIATRAPPFKR